MAAHVCVIAGNDVGVGIAAVFALSNLHVSVYALEGSGLTELMPVVREQCSFLCKQSNLSMKRVEERLERIRFCGALEVAARHADFVVEALPEDLERKQAIFKVLDRICPDYTVFASTTKRFALDNLMSVVSRSRRSRMLLTHWQQCPLVMPRVGLSFFGNMSEDDFEAVEALHQLIGAETVTIARESVSGSEMGRPDGVGEDVLVRSISALDLSLQEGTPSNEERRVA